MPTDEQFVENSRPSEYVGLIPAAGVGSRLPDRKLSKEVLPVVGKDGRNQPVVAHLLASMEMAGVTEVTAVIREGKQDVTDYLSGENWHHFSFTHKHTAGTSGVPETVAIGLEKIGSRNVLFGFPDILFEPLSAFRDMIDELENGPADVVLGLFPTATPNKMDMVGVDAAGRIEVIDIKPAATTLELTWILAAWKPAFSAYLTKKLHQDGYGEHLGEIFQRALEDGLEIRSSSFRDGRSLDIGTPNDLARASRWLA